MINQYYSHWTRPKAYRCGIFIGFIGFTDFTGSTGSIGSIGSIGWGRVGEGLGRLGQTYWRLGSIGSIGSIGWGRVGDGLGRVGGGIEMV